MTRPNRMLVHVTKLSPKLGLPPDRRTHFRCGHLREETGYWVGDCFRCEPCHLKAMRTYRKYRRELERSQ